MSERKEAATTRITPEQMADALQRAWDDFVDDTGCFPDCLSLQGKRISAEFDRGNFARYVAGWLDVVVALQPAGRSKDPCVNCGGAGEVTSSRTCGKCGGTGGQSGNTGDQP